MPELAAKVGHDLVTTSGDTLLGADDKAGVAEVMAAVAYLAAHPELPRPTIRVGFTPDEEVGEGAKLFDLEAFGASAPTRSTARRRASSPTRRSPRRRPTCDPRRRRPPRLRDRQARERDPARRPSPRRAAARADAGDDGRPRGLHPRLPGRGLGAARRRSARSCATSTTTGSPAHVALLRRIAEEVVATEPRARLEVEVAPQYPNMRTFLDERPEVVGGRRGGAAARGLRAAPRPDPRRHRRLDPERPRAPDAEPVHRRARVPLGPRVGVGAGHGVGRRRRGAARGRVGRARR